MIACQRDFTITVNAGPSIAPPTAYWKMDEASGTRADAIGVAANNLVLIVGPDLGDVTGLIGNAISFTGVGLSDYDTTFGGTLHYVPGTGLTIAFWVKFNSLVPPPTNHVNFELFANDLDFLVEVSNASVIFDFAPAAGPDAIATLAFAFATGIWYFIVAQYDPATQKTSVSVNNGAFTSSAVTASDAGTTIPADNSIYNIGAPNLAVDEAGLWLGHILTPTEITFLYNGGVGKTYPFS